MTQGNARGSKMSPDPLLLFARIFWFHESPVSLDIRINVEIGKLSLVGNAVKEVHNIHDVKKGMIFCVVC